MGPGFRKIQRLGRAAVGHPVLHKDGGLVDMPESDVGEGKSCQDVLVEGNVLRVAAVEHQDPDPLGIRNRQSLSEGRRNLRAMVAEAVNFRIQAVKINGTQLSVHEKGNIGIPGKA